MGIPLFIQRPESDPYGLTTTQLVKGNKCHFRSINVERAIKGLCCPRPKCSVF
jgi:hypothetical protein